MRGVGIPKAPPGRMGAHVRDDPQRKREGGTTAQPEATSSEQSALASTIEQVIRRLRGVIAVRVEVDNKGEAREVHVSAHAGRNAKQLARDIQSAVISQLGYRLDHKRISISAVEVAPSRAVGARLQLRAVSFSVDGSTAQARVTLTRAGDIYTGLASAPAYDYDEGRLIALATLNAVEEYVRSLTEEDEERPSLSLKDMMVRQDPPAQPAVLAWVRMVGGQLDETLLGSAVAQPDRWKAAARATLDAVNRRLGWFVE